jgi:hypothetical protein
MMRMFPVRTMEAMINTVVIRTLVRVVTVLYLIHQFPAFSIPSRMISVGFVIARLLPLPVTDFRHVLAVLIDVMLVLDELVLDHLLQVRALGAQIPQAIHHVLH